MIMWKQQGLLCVLISDLVSDDDVGKLKEYFVKVRVVDGAVRNVLSSASLAVAAGSRATTEGRAAMAQATMTTSESPKLYSDRPPTRKPVIAARLPITTARAATASGASRRRTPIA